MKVTTFCKFGISVGAAALLVGALAVPAANADPATDTYGTLVGLGSDTTQDVANGLALAIGGHKLASYDAFGTSTVITRDGGVAVPRGSGSGPGRDLLRVSIGQISNATIAVAPSGTAAVTAANSIGQIDFARSSSGPAAGDTRTDGVLTYIPFARDAVSVAVDPDSPLAVVPFELGSSATAGNSAPTLYNIYRGDVKYAYVSGTAGSYVYVGVGLSATAPQGATAYPIQPLLPKSGSGTRSFFIGKIGLTEAVIATQPAGTIKATYGAGLDVQEHDGSAIDGDLAAIAPFSIAQWVAQANGVQGVTDRRHGVVVVGLDGKAATTGSGTTFATNPQFAAMTRDVYNIVPTALAQDPTSDIAKTFVGATSLVCSAGNTIQAYGFQLLPATNPASTCGYKDLKAYEGSASSVSIELDETTIPATGTTTATATVNAGFHAKGGTVYIDDANGNELGSATLAAGATTVDVEVDPAELGSTTVQATFIPTLSGVKNAVSAEVPITVVAAESTVSVSAPSTLTIGKTAGLIAWVDGASDLGGTVTFRDGETTLATSVLTPGEQGAYYSFVAKKTSYALTASYTAPAGSGTADSVSVLKTLTVGKATPSVTTATVKTVKASQQAKVAVTIKGVTGIYATGTVTVTEGTKVLVATKTLSSKGTVTVTLPKLKKGTHTITVTYNGNAQYNTAAKSTVKVKIS
jgi:hypothetical protein